MQPLILGDEIRRMKNTLQAAGNTLGPMFHAGDYTRETFTTCNNARCLINSPAVRRIGRNKDSRFARIALGKVIVLTAKDPGSGTGHLFQRCRRSLGKIPRGKWPDIDCVKFFSMPFFHPALELLAGDGPIGTTAAFLDMLLQALEMIQKLGALFLPHEIPNPKPAGCRCGDGQR